MVIFLELEERAIGDNYNLDNHDDLVSSVSNRSIADYVCYSIYGHVRPVKYFLVFEHKQRNQLVDPLMVNHRYSINFNYFGIKNFICWDNSNNIMFKLNSCDLLGLQQQQNL